MIDYSLRDVGPYHTKQRLIDLNQDLEILVKIFPQVLPEAFREMLCTYDGESRLLTVVDQLLKHKDRYVRGRWRVNMQAEIPYQCCGNVRTSIPLEESFRQDDYILAVRTALYQEFKILNRSTVDTIIKERNYSYTRARSVLQQIAARSWKRKIAKLYSKWRKFIGDKPEPHHLILWPQSGGETGAVLPSMKSTGNSELDQELYLTIIVPLVGPLKIEQEVSDWALATEMNHSEAKYAESLYECECCFNDTTFEQLATCTASSHILCFRCLGLVLREALYGQSWARNFDHKSGRLRCFVPLPEDSCGGFIPREIFRRAIIQTQGGLEQWGKFETHFANENLIKSQAPLVRCPFCSYAEVDELYLPPKNFRYHFNTSNLHVWTLLLLSAIIIIPLGGICTFLWNTFTFSTIPSPKILMLNSLNKISYLRYRPERFQCQSPVCGLPSCISCSKLWRDPHICYESAVLSLRATVEAARTAALKRTCPRCGLSFVKESGCNKLSCICGCMICYTCRQHLGTDNNGEGYRHFCQHFRPNGGQCTECDRCDLYNGENEDILVQKAGELAESQWRKREGMVGVEGIKEAQDAVSVIIRRKRYWTAQGWMDWWVRRIIGYRAIVSQREEISRPTQ